MDHKAKMNELHRTVLERRAANTMMVQALQAGDARLHYIGRLLHKAAADEAKLYRNR